MSTVRIDAVKVGERFRRDLGDLTPLVSSIQRIGVLQPIVVDSNLGLIAGQRRLEACRKLGHPTIPAVVCAGLKDAVDALLAERDENTCRKDFTPSEAVALGMALEELERPKAQERMQAGQKTEPCGAAPEGRVRDIVAPAVGMKGTRYAQAKDVVLAVESTDPAVKAVATEALAEMDATGSVRTAYRRVGEAKRNSAIDRVSTPKTSAAVQARRDRIRSLAGTGHTSEQIAKQLGLNPQSVTRICNEHGIVLADKAMGKVRRIDADRVMDQTVLGVQSELDATFALMEGRYADLDRSKIEGWIDSLKKSRNALNRLLSNLSKETTLA